MNRNQQKTQRKAKIEKYFHLVLITKTKSMLKGKKSKHNGNGKQNN